MDLGDLNITNNTTNNITNNNYSFLNHYHNINNNNNNSLNNSNETIYCSDNMADLNTILSILRPSITPIDRYVSLVWFCIGLPGNLLSFLVWIRRKMRPSSGLYLAALALNDFFFLLLFIVSEMSTAWEMWVLHHSVICEVFPVIFYTCQYLSPFFILAFTVERYISVCHPYSREKLCTTKRNMVVVTCLVLYTLLLHSWQLYVWTMVDGVCTIRQNLSSTLNQVHEWFTEIQAFALVPIAIFLLNIRVIFEIHTVSKRQRETNTHKHTATTATLLLVSFYYIITTLPVTICFLMVPSFHSCLTFYQITSDPQWNSLLTFWKVRVIIQEIGASHYACNFLFYLLTASQFRREFKNIFGKFFDCCPSSYCDGSCSGCCGGNRDNNCFDDGNGRIKERKRFLNEKNSTPH